MQFLIGSLNWLSISTHPDISTAVSLLAKFTHRPSQGHVKYLKGTKNCGITFFNKSNNKLSSYINFPIVDDIATALMDANWGPQDQSIVSTHIKATKQLDLFKARSMSGYILWLNGQIHWVSKRQTYTARSLAEAEIYATDECAKQIKYLSLILHDINLKDTFMKQAIPIYNDN